MTSLFIKQLLCTLLLLSILPLSIQAKESNSVEDTVMNFALGFWQQNTEQVLNPLHPALSKKGIKRNWRKSGKEIMATLPPDRLEILATVYNSEGRLNDISKPKVYLHEVNEHFASLELVNDDWYDFFHAVKLDGEWKLLNCVYGKGREYPLPKSQEDTQAINAVIDHFVAGLAGDADKLSNSTHINLERRKFATSKSKQRYIKPIAREQMISNAGTFEFDVNDVKIELYNHTNRTAAARIDFGKWQEHVQLLKINEQWFIVNSFVLKYN